MTRTASLFIVAALFMAACGKSSDNAKPGDTTNASTTSSAKETSGETGTTGNEGRRYSVETGIVKAEMVVMGKQEVTIYFEDYGKRQAVHTNMTMEMGGKTMSQQQVAITDGATIVNYDPEKKTGTRSPAPTAGGPSEDPTNMGFSRMSDADKKKYNYKELESREYLGKETVGHQIEVEGMTMKAWTWEDIPMYLEIANPQMPQPIVMTVTSIETDVDIPDDKMTVPSDVTITDELGAKK